MSKQLSENHEVNESTSCHSDKTCWAWHLLILAACVSVLIALVFDVSFVERWFSSDGHLSEQGKNYYNLLRSGLFIVAAGCLVLWTLRKCISADNKVAVERWIKVHPGLRATEVIPSVSPVLLKRSLWMFFVPWILFVVISLVPGYEVLASQLIREKGFLETLTVIFYLFAGIISIRLAFPCWRRNSRKGLFRWWISCLALGCLFVAIEEINWGELYLHYEAAEVIRQSNYQNEVSLHNISLPFIGSYWANDLLQIIAFCGGVILPLMLRYSSFVRRMAWAAEVPLPPWLSQAYFFVAALIPQDNVIQLQVMNIPSELREVTIAFGVAIWLWSTLKNNCYQNSISDS